MKELAALGQDDAVKPWNLVQDLLDISHDRQSLAVRSSQQERIVKDEGCRAFPRQNLDELGPPLLGPRQLDLLAQREKSIDESINEYYTLSMKTAISIPDDLFEQVEKLSKKRQSSRSEVFATAVKDFLEKERSRELLSALDEAYSEAESAEEQALRARSKRYYARRIAKASHGD